MTTDVRVPTLGESVTEATVATWFKKPGDPVAVDEMLCELETDKVTVEVPSPIAGTLSEIVAAEGQTVGVDALLATITEGASATPAAPKPAETAAKPDAAATVDVMVPTLGESVTEATVSTWFKAVGDTVAADEMLCELETDKVSVEVPSPAAGVLTEITAPEGSTVDASAKLAVLSSSGSATVAAVKEAAPTTAPANTAIKDGPAAEKAMAAAGLSRDQVDGTGRDGRATKDDVAKAVARAAQTPVSAPLAPRAPVAADDAAREERVKMTRLRQTIARRLKDSQNTAAMLTTYNEVDMTEVMTLRNEYKDLFLKKHGVKLGFMSFFTKACCHALNEVPEVNAEIDGTDIVYKNFVHMGIAAGTPTGLVVPVIRDADSMS
ncbi:MAG: biotin/lipoyl-containing protein, partial [Paracoccaceae bacterium]